MSISRLIGLKILICQKLAGFRASNKNEIRILMAAWLMGVFVLSALYSTQLFGYLMNRIPVPIVNSAEELADKPGVQLVVAILAGHLS